jgi:transcriptional regulator with XRE-family HTH domain
MQIGLYIKDLHEAAGWSMSELARRAGISKGNLSKIIRCEIDPGLSTLEAIAKAFDMGAGDLLVAAGYSIKQPVPVIRSLHLSVRFCPDGSVIATPISTEVSA